MLKAQGAVLVDVSGPRLDGMGEAEFDVLKFELKSDLDKYLAATPAAVKTRSLDQVIAFNARQCRDRDAVSSRRRLRHGGEDEGRRRAEYQGLRAKSLRLAGAEGIDGCSADAKATILVQPTYGLPG